MCIAAISTKNGFEEDQLRAFFLANSDGGGYAWVEDGKLKTTRHLRTMESYLKEGARLKGQDVLLTHCRIATVGTVTENNAHPFRIGSRAVMAHNGTFFQYVPKVGMSDTAYLAERAAKLLGNEELMTRPGTIKEIERIVSYNKMIVLYENKNFLIVNEQGGTWNIEKTKWFSNRSWEHIYNREKVARAVLNPGESE